MKNRSNKQLALDRKYFKLIKEIDRELINKDEFKCFFCDKEFSDDFIPDHHHVCGKSSDELYLNKINIVVCHRECHRKYHDMCFSEVQKQVYYNKILKIIDLLK